MTSTSSNRLNDGKQFLIKSPGEQNRGFRQSEGADFFGIDDQRMTSPPPGSPPSSLHYSPVLSEVNSWEQLWEDVWYKHFHPITHMWTHFSQLRCSFLSSSPPAGVQGGVFLCRCMRFFGYVMYKTRRGQLGLALETNECLCNS